MLLRLIAYENWHNMTNETIENKNNKAKSNSDVKNNQKNKEDAKAKKLAKLMQTNISRRKTKT